MFQSSEYWIDNAHLNVGSNKQYTYSLGYKEAADFLAANASDINAQDLFVYPIAFLYRHHLELQLKLIIDQGNILLNQSKAIKNIHNLEKIWFLAKEIIIRIWPQGKVEELNQIDYVINEYQKVDPNSTAFRYPSDTQGNKHLSMFKHVNITSLSFAVNKAAEILDNIYHGLIEYIDTKEERYY